MRRLLCRDVVVVPSSRVLRPWRIHRARSWESSGGSTTPARCRSSCGRPWACWRARWRGWEARRRSPRLRWPTTPWRAWSGATDVVEPLQTVDANWLIQQPRREPVWVVEDLMPAGLHLLTGAPKIGKSWLVLDLALAVSAGRPFWGYATRRCGVLYLVLEDTLARIQGRMWGLSDTASERLCFALNSRSIADGLVDQLDDFAEGHEDTGLVIVDTLQKVRALKGFADEYGLAILAVHHTRKTGDDDVFNTVSGTTCTTGSADSTFVLAKQGRASEYATLSLTGRDVEFQELKLRFNDSPIKNGSRSRRSHPNLAYKSQKACV
nr:AAA family ATPase [Collinsella aerofaciens]